MRYAQYQRAQRNKHINRAAKARETAPQPVAEVVVPTPILTPEPIETTEEIQQPKRKRKRKIKPAKTKKKA